MATERSDQPSAVTLADRPRPPDEHVVTSDGPPVVEEPKKRASAEPNPDKGDDLDDDQDPDTAPGDDAGQKEPRRRRRNRGVNRDTARQLAELKNQTATIQAEQAASKSEIARLNAELEAAKQAALPVPKKPRLQDYSNEEQFAAAWKTYETALDKRKPAQASDPQTTTQHRPTEAPIPQADLDSFHSAGISTYGRDGWEEIKAGGDKVQVDVDMARFIAAAGNDGAVIYAHLTEFPETSVQISKMSAAAKSEALVELKRQAKAGELDDGTEITSAPLYDADERGNGKPGEKPGKPRGEGGKFTTSAPTPPTSGTRTSGAGSKNPETMSSDEYAAWRATQELAKRGIYPR